MSRASALLSVRLRVMSFPDVFAVKVMVVPDKVMASPPSPMSAWPLKSTAPAAVIDQSSPPVRAKVVEALELPMVMVSAVVPSVPI